MAIKLIQENCFENKVEGILSNEIERKEILFKGEYWQCGEQGHLLGMSFIS